MKIKNIFDKFCSNVYTIEYKKQRFSHIHLLVFIHSTDQFFKASQINEVICTELFMFKTDPTRKFTRIIASVILYGLYGNINFYLFCINKA